MLIVYKIRGGDAGMKLFLTRKPSDKAGFVLLDETACLRYILPERTEGKTQYIAVMTTDGKVSAEITHKSMVVGYFTVRCAGRRYVLVPCMKDYFGFAIYGSTYRFLGDIQNGRFSLFDVDKSPVMTQKKCWGKSGEGYELNIFREDREIFGICVAVCAAVYLAQSKRSRCTPDLPV